MSIATLSLPQVQKLRERAIPGHRMRDLTERYEATAKAVRLHWDDMPYPVKQELRRLAERSGPGLPKPDNLREFLLLLFAIAAVPFVIASDILLRDDDSITRYAIAVTHFISSVNDRMRDEEASAQQAWSAVTEGDPAFQESFKKGQLESKRGEFYEVDWTATPRLASR